MASYSVPAEKSALGCCLISKDACGQICNALVFTHHVHQPPALGAAHQTSQGRGNMLVVHIEIPGFPAGLHSVPQVLGDDGRMTAFYDLNMVWLIIDDFLGPVRPDAGFNGRRFIPADLPDIYRVI